MRSSRAWGTGSRRLIRLSRISLFLLLFAATLLLFRASREPLRYEEYREGEVALAPIVADFDLDVPKPREQYAVERRRAREEVAAFFRKDLAVSGRVLGRFERFATALQEVLSAPAPDTLARMLEMGRLSPAISERAQRALISPKRRGPVLSAVREVLGQVLSAGLAGPEAADRIQSGIRYMLMEGQSYSPVALRDLAYTREKVSRYAQQVARERFAGDQLSGDAFREILAAFLEDNIFYDQAETERVREAAANRVTPYERRILQGEMIVDAHQKVSPEAMRAIVALRSEQRARARGAVSWRTAMSVAGRGLLTLAILAFSVIYLRLHRPRVYADTAKLLLLAVTTLIILVAASVVLHVLHWPWFVIPIAAGSMIVSLLIDAQLGTFFTLVAAVIVALNGKLGLDFLSASLIGGLTGVYSVRRVRHRSEILRALIYVALAYVFASGALGLMQGRADYSFLENSLWGLLNAFASITIVFFMIPVLEMTCGVTTDLTLLELSDLNRPLLKRLMLEAPGTYHHSMVMGTLAEAACEAIGANSLLARVQSYYHDIGKLNKPEYFVENVALNPRVRNPHDRLTPSMSRLILESHVREGVALAREFKLPEGLIDSIREHHGTSEMSFFYEKAKQLDPTLERDEFRYPGPKPQTKETAIVMIADAVEASSRVLTDPHPSRLRGLVKKIIETRVEMGELEECGLTLAELAKVREALVVALTGMFHGRIRYPSDDARSDAAKPSRPRPARTAKQTRQAAGNEAKTGGSAPR